MVLYSTIFCFRTTAEQTQTLVGLRKPKEKAFEFCVPGDILGSFVRGAQVIRRHPYKAAPVLRIGMYATNDFRKTKK